MIYYKMVEIEKDLALDNVEGTLTLLLDGKYYTVEKGIDSESYPEEEGLFINIIDI